MLRLGWLVLVLTIVVSVDATPLKKKRDVHHWWRVMVMASDKDGLAQVLSTVKASDVREFGKQLSKDLLYAKSSIDDLVHSTAVFRFGQSMQATPLFQHFYFKMTHALQQIGFDLRSPLELGRKKHFLDKCLCGALNAEAEIKRSNDAFTNVNSFVHLIFHCANSGIEIALKYADFCRSEDADLLDVDKVHATLSSIKEVVHEFTDLWKLLRATIADLFLSFDGAENKFIWPFYSIMANNLGTYIDFCHNPETTPPQGNATPPPPPPPPTSSSAPSPPAKKRNNLRRKQVFDILKEFDSLSN